MRDESLHMDDWKLPDYAAAAGRDPEDGSAIVDDHGTLLAGHEHEDSEDEGKEVDAGLGSRKSIKSSLWMILMTIATLAARRILNGGFRKFCPVGLLQLPLDMEILECDTC